MEIAHAYSNRRRALCFFLLSLKHYSDDIIINKKESAERTRVPSQKHPRHQELRQQAWARTFF